VAAEPAAASWHEAPEPPLASAVEEAESGALDGSCALVRAEADGRAPPEPAAEAATTPPAACAAIEAAVAELLADLVGGGPGTPGRAPGAGRTSALLGSTALAA
jgi:hypothetical protein